MNLMLLQLSVIINRAIQENLRVVKHIFRPTAVIQKKKKSTPHTAPAGLNPSREREGTGRSCGISTKLQGRAELMENV